MLIVFFRALILYFVVILCVRLMGKRQLGELQPTELVITILMSNIATLPVEDVNIPMSMGIIPIFTLVSLDVLVSFACLKSRRLAKAVSGTAKIIISDGRIDQHTLKELRFSPDDLMASLRSVEIFDPSEVQLAVVETTGKISVCRKKSQSPPTCQQLDLKCEESDPPVMVITDGKPSPAALRHLGLDTEWLEKTLRKKQISPKDIFIMCVSDKDTCTIIKKEKSQ